jgi:hypothetical protein
MFPHYSYYPPMHGYYYFRPYHHCHIARHQSLVSCWGGDPRNPYSNEIFKAVSGASEPVQEEPLSIPTPIPLPQ